MPGIDNTQSTNNSLTQTKVQSLPGKCSGSSWGRSVKNWASKKVTDIGKWLRPDGKSLNKRRVVALVAMCLGGGLFLGAAVTAFATLTGGASFYVPVVVGGGLVFGGYCLGRRP